VRRDTRARISAVVVAAGLASSLYGWSNHTLGTYPALGAMPEVARGAPVRVESLRAFLATERRALATVLRDEEAWDRANVPRYPPLPGGLAFRADGPPDTLTARFLAALRLDPRIFLGLYVQPPFGTDVSGEATVSPDQVTFLKTLKLDQVFVRLEEGEGVSPLEVVATASDEPDYGMDIGLWEDDGTSFGREYGMGRQPFGNPVLEYSSQAPFHMGFYHEAAIVYRFAPYLERTYPEYRIHQFLSLARFAFARGHGYWGWRFAGWGLHYVQDLTQPYHARVLPGVPTARIVWAGALAAIGIAGPEKDLRQLVTNRHLALEDYEKRALEVASRAHRGSDPLLRALADTRGDGRYGAFNAAYVRDTLTRETAARADAADRTLRRWLPERIVDDPSYLFGETDPNVDTLAAVEAAGPAATAAMRDLLCRLLRAFGAHSRNLLRAILPPPAGAAVGARR
jgi:hypothetical protein